MKSQKHIAAIKIGLRTPELGRLAHQFCAIWVYDSSELSYIWYKKGYIGHIFWDRTRFTTITVKYGFFLHKYTRNTINIAYAKIKLNLTNRFFEAQLARASFQNSSMLNIRKRKGYILIKNQNIWKESYYIERNRAFRNKCIEQF